MVPPEGLRSLFNTVLSVGVREEKLGPCRPLRVYLLSSVLGATPFCGQTSRLGGQVVCPQPWDKHVGEPRTSGPRNLSAYKGLCCLKPERKWRRDHSTPSASLCARPPLQTDSIFIFPFIPDFAAPPLTMTRDPLQWWGVPLKMHVTLQGYPAVLCANVVLIYTNGIVL